jgi:hypothetical protein
MIERLDISDTTMWTFKPTFKYSCVYIHETDIVTCEGEKKSIQKIVDLFKDDKILKLDIRRCE